MSTEYLYSITSGELRAVERGLRTDLPDFATVVTATTKKKKDESKRFDLNDGYYYEHTSSYDNGITKHRYTIGKDKKKGGFHFTGMQYPACCGISILHDFYGYRSDLTIDEVKELLKRFFEYSSYNWQPNIQLVAVRNATEYEESESELTKDDDDWYEEEPRKPIAWASEYNVPDFINNLISVYNPTLISSFVNPNSDNICDVYQFETPKEEE